MMKKATKTHEQIEKEALELTEAYLATFGKRGLGRARHLAKEFVKTVPRATKEGQLTEAGGQKMRLAAFFKRHPSMLAGMWKPEPAALRAAQHEGPTGWGGYCHVGVRFCACICA